MPQVRAREKATPAQHEIPGAKQRPAQFVESKQRQTGEDLEQKLHGMAAVRHPACGRRQDMENRVSVDDFPPPGNLDNRAAARNVIPLPQIFRGIALWWIALDRPESEVAELARTLSSEEIARAGRFGTESLRLRWIVGRSTLRLLLGEVLGVAPSAVTLVRGRRGRPELALASPDFNVSHTCGMALVGIADALPAGTRIGVDVEHGQRKVNADLLSRKFLSDRERAGLAPLTAEQRRRGFLRLWTCKEAMSKATGDGLIAPFRRLDVGLLDALRLLAGPPPYLPSRWSLHHGDVPEGWLATVAIWHGP
jgi:4'-phosphopantetheinyl transferase